MSYLNPHDVARFGHNALKWAFHPHAPGLYLAHNQRAADLALWLIALEANP